MFRPAVLESPQLTAVRAWWALAFWATAGRVRRVGAVVSVLVALAPVWAAVPRASALGAAVVCLAVAVLARDACQWIGDVLAPPACAPSVDLHCCVPAAPDPCLCGDVPAPGTAVRRMN